MGAQASRDADADSVPPDPQDEQLAARAWRTGVPFTLLHDEGFVVEKYQELLAASSAQPASKLSGGKALKEAQTTVSGLDEAPMDELQHATDMARIKLFARTKRDEGELNGSRPGSPSTSAATASTLTSSAAKENPPSALARMVGDTLSRESPESVESEKLRVQRDELLQVYFQQVAARMKQKQLATEGESIREEELEAAVTTETSSATSCSELPVIAEGRKILQDVTPASIFSVGSLRLQLEMLREFRVLSPRLFEKGVMALVQTLVDSPPFALRDIGADTPEDVLLNDLHRFCRDILHPEQGEQGATGVQHQVTLLLLLALGVSSGRISLLLEFVGELLAMPCEIATSVVPLQGYPFSAWIRLFMMRMQSYRIEFALGTFEDSTFVKKVAVKALPGEVDPAAKEDTDNDSAGLNSTLPSSSLATDGSYAYTWSMSKGLAKIGTGLNFTIAGRVYAEIPASVYMGGLEEKRAVRKLVYGFGEQVTEVSEVAKEEMARVLATTSSFGTTVQDIFGAAGQLDPFTAPKLLVSYSVGNRQDVCILENGDTFALRPFPSDNGDTNVRICRAWYGDFDILSNEALLEFLKLLGQKRSTSVDDNGEMGIVLTHDLLEQLLTLSDISPEKIVESKKLMVIFAAGNDSETVGAQLLREGDRFVDAEERTRDAYLSSLLYCGDSLYLNVMYPEIDLSGMLTGETKTTHRCRQLLRISPKDLGLLETLRVEDASSSSVARVPLYAYVTEGRFIYEINMGLGGVGVNVITPKTASGQGTELVITRQFVLDEKAIQCCEFVLCMAKIRNTMMINEDKLDGGLPCFYTNGASLGMLVVHPNAEELVTSKNRVHCVLFDCESGLEKKQQENGEGSGCSERSLPLAQVSFVGLACADGTSSRRAFEVAVKVFDTIRDACTSLLSNLADQTKHQDRQAQWLRIENVLKDGFVGVLAPVILSSGIMFLRNHKNIAALISRNDDNAYKPYGKIESLQGDDASANKTPHVTSRLFELLKDNSSEMLKFMTSLDVLVSFIEPTKRENTVENVSMALKTETMESSHEYENNMDALTELQVPGATRMVITFDPRSRTEVNYDYLTFYKDKSQGEYYGNQFYSGRDSEHNWPGVGDNPPLIIESDHCFVYFHSDGSNTDWGYKFTATAEILEKKKSLQQHWIVFLLESVVQLLDESMKLLVDGSTFAPIEDMEIQNEQYLQSDLLKSGVCTEVNKNAEVLQLLQDFVDPSESSDAKKVIDALQESLTMLCA
ncbi:hypothetical protein PF007_g4314 [Phytophthora fragariae]|uniref:HECT domain-containing protein n=1 Tax=Phytophthora fragariae TaxID=53985 RepID=A0A6A3TBY2_9STRA|nr:hypothetical protein PF007_g4314 [Phytophthora fragariae]